MASRAIHPKSSCSVLGCRRASRCFRGEWICGEHWRLIDRNLKTFYRRQMRKLYRLWEAAEARAPGGRQSYRLASRWRAAERVIWGRIKRQAVERAAGL